MDQAPHRNRLSGWLFGAPKDIHDRSVFHKLALVPFLAWIGLGADGLSSSCYGPEEAFRTLGSHTYLAIGIAIATTITVIAISLAYSRIIEHFPFGGGGYFVATKTLGRKFGVVSGCALLVDYVLTIAVSIASGGDALFSFLPASVQAFKFPAELASIVVLGVLNIRGVKESVLILAPIFLTFLATHVVLIGYGLLAHVPEMGATAAVIHTEYQGGLGLLGSFGMLLLFLHAFSMGAGTYTGIEAVSNGLPIMREPRVRTAKKTMTYMATSLSLAAGGLLVCYLLWQITPVPGKTMNAVLLERVSAHFPLGNIFTIVALLSEGALLIVAAQAGFIDGPRVLANMSADGWLPRRFTSLSERLTMGNGILIMSLAALAFLIYTHGDVRSLVVIYSINVFLTFSLSTFGMARWHRQTESKETRARRSSAVFVIAFIICISILAITIAVKFREGAWLTLIITGGFIGLCFLIQSHYTNTSKKIAKLTADLPSLPGPVTPVVGAPDKDKPVAGVLISGYTGLGIHTVLTILTQFAPRLSGVIFISVGQVDSGRFKGEGAVAELEEEVENGCKRFVEYVHHLGLPAAYRFAVGVDVVDELEKLCAATAADYPHIIYFGNQLIFRRERWYHAILHNHTVFALQRRLLWDGLKLIIWPTRLD